MTTKYQMDEVILLLLMLFNKNLYLVDESYNSNPLSLKSALKNFNMIWFWIQKNI